MLGASVALPGQTTRCSMMRNDIDFYFVEFSLYIVLYLRRSTMLPSILFAFVVSVFTPLPLVPAFDFALVFVLKLASPWHRGGV